MVILSGTAGAGFIKAGFASVTSPGTVIVRSNTEGMTSFPPSAICQVPFRLIVSRTAEFFPHPAIKIIKNDKNMRIEIFFMSEEVNQLSVKYFKGIPEEVSMVNGIPGLKV